MTLEIIDPNSVKGQQAIRNAAFLTPTTQGDPPPPLRLTLAPDVPWYLITARTLGLRDRLRVLFGAPIVVRFESPDGLCHAACTLSVSIKQRPAFAQTESPSWSNPGTVF